MHARELIELAALVSLHGPALVRAGRRLSDASMEQYWVASKSRLDRWGRALKRLASPDPATRPLLRPLARGVLEEIITGEVLTRVWTALTCAYDRRHGTEEAEPIARSVLIAHLEARHRVLTLLVRGPSIDAEQGVMLNRLRRRAERWSDLLVGYLAGLEDVSEFAVDPDRARDFARDLRRQSRLRGGRFAWPLILASLRAAFAQGAGSITPNGDLNAQIAVSILSSLPPELFDSTGTLHSLWLLRLSNAASDAEGMVEELLGMDETPCLGRPSRTHRRYASG